MKKRKPYNLLLVIILFLAGCKDEYSICNESRNVLLQTNLYTLNSGTEQPFAASSFTLSVLNIPQPIYNNVSELSSFLLPLNPVMDSAVYKIVTSTTAIADTLTILYATNNIQLSPACGTLNVHRILRVSSTRNTIDSVKINNADITNLLKENIKIYY